MFWASQSTVEVLPMDQHPVPQNITSYEFRLVGDMTLKQFFQLAGGGIVGVVIYQLPLPFFIKWPLIFIAVGIGAALAFVPVQGRPFSQWLTAFFGAIYAPTEYYWSPSLTPPVSPPKLGGESQRGSKPSALDQFETQFFSKVTHLFGQNQVTSDKQQEVAASIPEEQFHTIVKQEYVEPNVVYETQTPVVAPAAAPAATPALTTDLVPTPEYTNILTGLIKDTADRSVENAIVEIVNSQTGMPARALRTNKLGQFQIATPLSAGEYTVVVDKENLTFNPVTIKVDGSIIKPILIKAV